MEQSPEQHRDQEAASDMAANAVINYLHQCNVEGEAQKRKWITRVFDKVISKELTH